MVDNQHRLITGYRELNEDEIDAMNRVKMCEDELLGMVSALGKHHRGDVKPDPGWLAIAKTDLQKGFMALTRSIAKRDGY